MFYIKQSSRPSYPQGFARNASESANPGLWTGKVGHWVPSLGVTGINTLYDISGYGNHGTMNGTMIMDDWVVGENGYALDFDGIDDEINVGSGASLDDLAPITFAALVRPLAGAANNTGFFGKGGTSAGRIGFMWRNTRRLRFLKNFSTSDLDVRTDNETLVEGVWQHIVLTWDGTATAANVGIYKNAIAQAHTTDTDGVGSAVTDAAEYLAIGSRGGSNYLNSQMDDVRIYNRILSASEIWQLYNDSFADLRRGFFGGMAPVAAGGTLTINVADCVQQEEALV